MEIKTVKKKKMVSMSNADLDRIYHALLGYEDERALRIVWTIEMTGQDLIDELHRSESYDRKG